MTSISISSSLVILFSFLLVFSEMMRLKRFWKAVVVMSQMALTPLQNKSFKAPMVERLSGLNLVNFRKKQRHQAPSVPFLPRAFKLRWPTQPKPSSVG